MKKGRRWLAALGITLALAMGAKQAQAVTATTSYLDLRVTFSATLSVAVDGIQYSTRSLGSLASNVLKATASSATVTNDSSGLTEKWQLSVATVSGSGNWAVQGTTTTAPGIDQYALQALFISSGATSACPGDANVRWNQFISTVTGTAATYTTDRYADTTSVDNADGKPDGQTGAQNGNMIATSAGTPGQGKRGLCARIYMPSGTAALTEQVIRLSVIAVAGG